MQKVRLLASCLFLIACLLTIEGPAAQRSMEQDPSLNNLVHPEGYQTAPPGTFGHVEKRGNGPVPLILIPGLGFGWEEFSDFMDRNRESYTMYAVTLAGMGGTPAPPMPPPGTSYSEQTWFEGAVTALLHLIEREGLERPVLAGHSLEGSDIGFRMALEHPGQLRGLILLAGSAKMAQPGQNITLQQRIDYMDDQMSQKWFKTVTLKTWNDNNWKPADYSIDLERGRRLFDKVDDGPLQVFVRNLLEFHSDDLTLKFGQIKVPTLLLLPGFKPEILNDPNRTYLRHYFLDSWEGAEKNPKIKKQVIENAHMLPWQDQPEAVSQAIAEFVRDLK